jgi:hypothetical protein
MKNLGYLNVSLTKHGAHKIAALLKKYNKDDVLTRLAGVEPDINIDAAQAKKTLSTNARGQVPPVWNKARDAGGEAIDALVLIAIIFSHHRLIDAMRRGRTRNMRGRIKRGEVIDGKEFTNFAHTIDELGYGESHTADHVSYNLSQLFEIPGLNKMVLELAALKFQKASWDKKKSLIDELVDSNFNEVFAVSAEKFRNWLTGHIGEPEALEDVSFFLDTIDDDKPDGTFHFKAGHNPKKTGTIDVAPSSGRGKADLLHNKLQTILYEQLQKKYGDRCVGTEQSTGHGTSVDLVVKTKSFLWFYEIKVASSLKACVRQAIPQLLEYAYWHQKSIAVDRLYVAANFKPTKEVTEYLELLRSRFDLPIYYEQIED